MIADVVLLLYTSPIPWQPDHPVLASPVSREQTARNNRHHALSLSLFPAVISRCRSWVMLLLVDVGPRAIHLTGYCCLFTKVCGASGNTLYWELLLVYVGSRATLLLGIVVGFCGASDNTLYWVLLFGLRGALGNTLY
jgi:hypothetical protein